MFDYPKLQPPRTLKTLVITTPACFMLRLPKVVYRLLNELFRIVAKALGRSNVASLQILLRRWEWDGWIRFRRLERFEPLELS
jgi:hypothetical protein